MVDEEAVDQDWDYGFRAYVLLCCDRKMVCVIVVILKGLRVYGFLFCVVPL